MNGSLSYSNTDGAQLWFWWQFSRMLAANSTRCWQSGWQGSV